MSEDIVKTDNARAVFQNILKLLDELEWQYKKNDELFYVQCGIKGDDLPIEFLLQINPKIQIVKFLSPLPFSVPKEKLIDVVLAVTATNNLLHEGNFDVDLNEGLVVFRMTMTYYETELTPMVLKRMVYLAANTIDEFNDKFLKIINGELSYEDFLKIEE